MINVAPQQVQDFGFSKNVTLETRRKNKTNFAMIMLLSLETGKCHVRNREWRERMEGEDRQISNKEVPAGITCNSVIPIPEMSDFFISFVFSSGGEEREFGQ